MPRHTWMLKPTTVRRFARTKQCCACAHRVFLVNESTAAGHRVSRCNAFPGKPLARAERREGGRCGGHLFEIHPRAAHQNEEFNVTERRDING
jgi:hypothetical protein